MSACSSSERCKRCGVEGEKKQENFQRKKNGGKERLEPCPTLFVHHLLARTRPQRPGLYVYTYMCGCVNTYKKQMGIHCHASWYGKCFRTFHIQKLFPPPWILAPLCGAMECGSFHQMKCVYTPTSLLLTAGTTHARTHIHACNRLVKNGGRTKMSVQP